MSAAAIKFAGQAGAGDELAGANPMFINARALQDGSVRSRPGIAAWDDFPADSPSVGAGAVTAMALFGSKVVFTTEDRRVFAWTAAGVVRDLSFSGAAAMVAGDLRPTIAVSGNLCIIAGGRAPQRVTTALVSERLPGTPDAPPESVDVAILTQRIVLTQRNSDRFAWSGVLPTGDETWDGAVEFREAEARADQMVAGRDTTREFWAFGTDTLQVFAPDPVETFTPVAAADVGCLTRTSVVFYEGMAAWLDNRRQIRLSDGRSLGPDTVISGDIASTLQALGTVSDCWAYRETIGADDCLIWVFPTEGRAFVRSMKTGVWGESRGWSAGHWGAFKPTCYLPWADRNLFLAGMPDGTIARLSADAHTDLGASIKWLARSGFDDYGTQNPKDPVEMQMVVRRGEAASDDSRFRVRWRDDLGEFSQPLDVPLGTTHSMTPEIPIRPCGAPFHRRQVEISSTAAEAFTMARATMFFEELEA